MKDLVPKKLIEFMTNKEITEFLEERESVGEHLINVRRWAGDMADRKFKEEYEEKYKWDELYEITVTNDETGEPICWGLREEYSDIYWGMVDEFEGDLLEYKNEEYE